jgi:hypothetical protein
MPSRIYTYIGVEVGNGNKITGRQTRRVVSKATMRDNELAILCIILPKPLDGDSVIAKVLQICIL